MDRSADKPRATRLQEEYYQRTAATYDECHVAHDDEHGMALDHISAVCSQLGIGSLLDVGCGTGRAIRRFAGHSDLEMLGVEPVEALLAMAAVASSPALGLVQASGAALPFRSGSLDAVCATGVMHHVSDARPIVAEMMRVARVGVFISDYNRFGAGPVPWRWAKLVLARSGAWPWVYRIRTAGRGYNISDGDGVAYSYSIYDSFTQLLTWTDHVYVIPTAKLSSPSWFSPLLNSTHGLICAIRPRPAA